MKIDEILDKLSRSKFRNSLHLNKNMKQYVRDNGIDVIVDHAYYFILSRLASSEPNNDGKQTPMKGHPVFIAQHACACCCRTCLEKWHHIPRERSLNKDEIKYIVNLIMKWILRECNL